MELWIDDLQRTSLTKNELTEQLSEQMGVTAREARELVDAFFEILVSQLKHGKTVKLANFGTFHVNQKDARPGRNLRTSEPVQVQARQSVTFATGPKLRQQLQASQARSAPKPRQAAAAQTVRERNRPRTA
jgi:integration host factor subunit alpha